MQVQDLIVLLLTWRAHSVRMSLVMLVSIEPRLRYVGLLRGGEVGLNGESL